MSRTLAFVAALGLAVVAAPLVFADEDPRADRGKSIAELPVERVVTGTRPDTGMSTDEGKLAVPPGVVRWHDGLVTARASSAKSGRPVLLFQLLGRLDEEFC